MNFEAQLFQQLPGDGVIGIMPTREKHRVRFLEEHLDHSRPSILNTVGMQPVNSKK